MLRVLRRLTRPTSSPTGGNVVSVSSYNTLNNSKSLCRAAASRLVDFGYQTHNDMSSTGTLQLCRLNNHHAVGTRSSSLLHTSNALELQPTTIYRTLSSEDADLNQVRESHLNLSCDTNILW